MRAADRAGAAFTQEGKGTVDEYEVLIVTAAGKDTELVRSDSSQRW